MSKKKQTKPIPSDKLPCKGCITYNICKDMGAWNSCKLQKKDTMSKEQQIQNKRMATKFLDWFIDPKNESYFDQITQMFKPNEHNDFTEFMYDKWLELFHTPDTI